MVLPTVEELLAAIDDDSYDWLTPANAREANRLLDAIDITAAKQSLADPERIPYKQFRGDELGLPPSA